MWLSRCFSQVGCVFIFLALLTGCEKDVNSGPKKEKPASVEAHPSEADIYRIVLTPKAQERLQISTVPAVQQSVPRSRSLGGELVIPDGRLVSVTAPLTGTLMPADDGSVPLPGQIVASNHAVLKLTPMLPPQQEVPTAAERVQMANARASLVSAQIQAEGDLEQAEAQVVAADIALDRARKLLADKAGSRRAVDEAEAARNIAAEVLEAAADRKALLEKLTLEAESGKVPVVSIQSPQNGMIRTVTSRVGQLVNSGAVLFEVVDLSSLWIRIPLYAGAVREIDTSREAHVSSLGDHSEDVPARLIPAPPTADSLAASVDLYYEVDNSDGRFRPGERVTVQLPISGETESLVVPRASVLWDIHGTAWVYVRSDDHEFRRERVSVVFTTQDLAVLSLGPDVGTPVVVDGAAELFGTEFGAGK